MDKYGNSVIDNNIFIEKLPYSKYEIWYFFAMANAVDLIMLNDDNATTKYFMILYSYLDEEFENQNLYSIAYSLSNIGDNKYVVHELSKYSLLPDMAANAAWPDPICTNILDDDSNLMAVAWTESATEMFGQT